MYGSVRKWGVVAALFPVTLLCSIIVLGCVPADDTPSEVANEASNEVLSASQSAAQREAQKALEQASKKTVADMRNVGAAMMSWLTDQASGGEDALDMALEGYPDAWRTRSPKGETWSFRRISYGQMVALLVPDYTDEVPPNDGWGNVYEYAINEDYWAEGVISVRSAGRDGEFASVDYEVGQFPMNEADHDIVWMDGYFVRWPDSK